MRYYKMSRAAVMASCAVLAASSVAYAEVKSHSVKGTATTEKFACEAAVRIAKIGLDEDELISISPCRCAKTRSNYYDCFVDVTYETKD